MNVWINAMQKIFFIICICLNLASLHAFAEAKKIVKWVDSKGVTHYGDKLPTQENGRSNTEMNNHGVVIKKNIVLDQQAAVLDHQKEQEKLDQARRDKILLASYTNAQEIDLARDRNLETDQAALQALTQQKQINTNRISRSNATAQQLKKANKPLPTDLSDELKQAKLESDTIDKQIKQRNANIVNTRKHYAEEKDRFIALKQNNLNALEPSSSSKAAFAISVNATQ